MPVWGRRASVGTKLLTCRCLFSGVIALTALSTAASAEDAQGVGEDAVRPDSARPVLVEMFLSQSCKASPPAAAFAELLAQRPDVVALTWHVDYWNALAARAAGPWRDPYSNAAFGERQIAYNARIRGRERGFSPQAVINGSYSAVGFEREAIESAIDSARQNGASGALTITAQEDDLAISVRTGPAEAYFVEFHPAVVTQIAGGDNAGLILSEPNVVASIKRLGETQAEGSRFSAPRPDGGMGCAVILHEPGMGRVIAARYCP